MGQVGTSYGANWDSYNIYQTHTRIKAILLEKEEFKSNQLLATTIHTCNYALRTTGTTHLFPNDQFSAKI